MRGGLPLIKGPDNQHEAAFMELSLFEQFAFTTPVPGGLELIELDVQEQAAKARQSSIRCKDDQRWQSLPSMMAIVAIGDITDGKDCHQ